MHGQPCNAVLWNMNTNGSVTIVIEHLQPSLDVCLMRRSAGLQMYATVADAIATTLRTVTLHAMSMVHFLTNRRVRLLRRVFRPAADRTGDFGCDGTGEAIPESDSARWDPDARDVSPARSSYISKHFATWIIVKISGAPSAAQNEAPPESKIL